MFLSAAWPQNKTTGGEKGLPVEVRLRVSRRRKMFPSAALGPKTTPHEEKKVSHCCFGTKTTPQEEKKVSQWRRRQRFPSAALSQK